MARFVSEVAPPQFVSLMRRRTTKMLDTISEDEREVCMHEREAKIAAAAVQHSSFSSGSSQQAQAASGNSMHFFKQTQMKFRVLGNWCICVINAWSYVFFLDFVYMSFVSRPWLHSLVTSFCLLRSGVDFKICEADVLLSVYVSNKLCLPRYYNLYYLFLYFELGHHKLFSSIEFDGLSHHQLNIYTISSTTH